MRCPNCGAQKESETGSCPHCRQEATVKVLNRQDRDNFTGVTIEDEHESGSHREYTGGHQQAGYRTRVKNINVSFNSSGLTGKLLLAAVVALLIFFFLPLLMFILAVTGVIIVAVWLLRMLRR
ncbi:hypothetical protein SCACP_24240 [Sporomusa carbonis]|uniref:hypothetical protein n=1 Tax=Sporomusa carbonis TaxID=3076075 RepID=UPI003A703DEC